MTTSPEGGAAKGNQVVVVMVVVALLWHTPFSVEDVMGEECTHWSPAPPAVWHSGSVSISCSTDLSEVTQNQILKGKCEAAGTTAT